MFPVPIHSRLRMFSRDRFSRVPLHPTHFPHSRLNLELVVVEKSPLIKRVEHEQSGLKTNSNVLYLNLINSQHPPNQERKISKRLGVGPSTT